MSAEWTIKVGRCFWACLIAVVAVLPSAIARGATVEWRNVPISVVLPVGRERVIAFPDHVQIGVPSTLPPEAFRTQSTGGTALWLARQPFRSQRLHVRLLSTGHMLLFDVTAVEANDADAGPLEIVFPSSTVGEDGATALDEPLGPVTLTRFAAQRLYAPERVLRELPGVRRVPMGAPKSVPLYRDDQVAATPLASWQGGDFYVTAVLLTHSGHDRLILDPRLLKGRFVAATFQHNSLGAAGSRSDTTCVYVVTKAPFMASIIAAGSEAPDAN